MLPRALARRGALAAAMRRPRRAARASGAAARGCSSLRVVIRGLLALPGRLGPWEAFCRGLLAGHASHACGSPGAARKTACPDPFHRFGLRPLPVGLRRAGRRPLHSMPGRRALLLLTLTRQTTTTTTTTTTATTTRQRSGKAQLGTRCPRLAPAARLPGQECLPGYLIRVQSWLA